MDVSITAVVFPIIFCYLWEVEARGYDSIISVLNGAPWGLWGKKEFCSFGFATGFSLKVKLDLYPAFQTTSQLVISDVCALLSSHKIISISRKVS